MNETNANLKPERFPAMTRLEGYLIRWLDQQADLYDSKRGAVMRLFLKALYWWVHRDGEEMATHRLAQFLIEAQMLKHSQDVAQVLLQKQIVAERNESAAKPSRTEEASLTGEPSRPARTSRPTSPRLAHSHRLAVVEAVVSAWQFTPLERGFAYRGV